MMILRLAALWILGFALGSSWAEPLNRWERVSNPRGGDVHGLGTNGNVIIAYGEAGLVTSSEDGRTWQGQESVVTEDLWGDAWNGQIFVVVGERGVIQTSPDGHKWSPQDSGTAKDLDAVAWDGNQFVAVGYFGAIVTSPDGFNWTVREAGIEDSLLNVIWDGVQFIAVSLEGTAFSSPDGITWLEAATPAAGGWLEALIRDDVRYVASGQFLRFMTSEERDSWQNTPITVEGSHSSAGIQELAWNGVEYVAAGISGTLLSSFDGSNWRSEEIATDETLFDVIWTGSAFFVGGRGGIFMGAANRLPENGLWVSEEAANNGFAIEIQSGFAFLTAFTYDVQGNAAFLTAQADFQPLSSDFIGEIRSPLYRTENGNCPGCSSDDNNPPATTAESELGELVVQFTDSQNGLLSWNGVTIPIRRFYFNAPVEGPGETDFAWLVSPQAESNGFALEVQNGFAFVAAFTYSDTGDPTFFTAQGMVEDDPGGFAVELESELFSTSGGPCPGCTNTPGMTMASELGSLQIRIGADQSGELTWNGRTLSVSRFNFN